MELEHAVDQVLDRAALLRDGGEVAQVLLAGREVVRQVRRAHALVAGDDDLRVQRGDRVDAHRPAYQIMVNPPQGIRETAARYAVPSPSVEIRGHDAIYARVTRAYEMFIADGEYLFEQDGEVVRHAGARSEERRV